jgi:V/A-type H+-transporting ATPase subunit K
MGLIAALIGLGCMVGLAGAGSAIGTGTAGSAALGLLKKRPDLFGSGIVLTAVPGTQGLYGFVMFFLYQSVISPDMTPLQGGIILGSGLAIGFACIFSGMYQGRVCADGIAAIGSGHNVFGNTMILAAYPEFYAILSLIAGILLRGLLPS